MQNDVKEVLIIGAGASGIAAATRLYERGVKNILVIEAENRLGGRVHTIDLANDQGFLELGAQWIHGEEKNVVFEMAFPRNLVQHSEKFSKMLYVRSSSEIVNQKISERLWNQFEEIQAHIDEEDLKNFESVGNYYIHKIKEAFEKINEEISADLKEEFVEIFHQYINTLDGSDSWFHTASSTLKEYWNCAGDLLISWKERGYKTIFSILMENCQMISNNTFLDKHIVKNAPVRKIGVCENVVRIECVNGTVHFAKHVIVTVSLGVLKDKYENMFEDIPLPKEKILAIENLAFGTVNKIYLKFPYKWWPDDIKLFFFLWKKEDREEYVKKGLSWPTDIVAFSRVDNAPNMLCGWVTGKSSRSMELTAECELCVQLTEVLHKFLGSHYKIPDVEYCIRSSWSSNEHFRGSYSSRTPLSDKLGVSTGVLSAPLINKNGVPMVLFAGEATHDHYYSTVHGAIETGWREADRILSLLDK